MKGRIGKNFEAEGRTALEKENNKGHHHWRTQGFGKWGVGGHHRGSGGQTPSLWRPRGSGGLAPSRQQIFTIFT